MDTPSTKQVGAASVILGAALLALFISSDPASTTITIMDNRDKTEAIVATGTHMQMTEYADNGHRLYSLEVAEWTQYRGAQNTYIELMRPKVRLFDDTYSMPWHISAQSGSATKQGHSPHLTLSDQVQLHQATTSSKPMNLRSDSLSVNAADDSVVARGNVVLNFGALRTEAPVMILQKNSTLQFNRHENLRVISTIFLVPATATQSSVAKDV